MVLQLEYEECSEQKYVESDWMKQPWGETAESNRN